ncbi:hypothetical protein ACWD01_37150, partial [Streptomyces sp. NPDC002835]
MAMDFWRRPVPPSVPLVKELCEAGAYVRDGDRVKGLIYQPFADHVRTRWGLHAQAVPDLPATRIPEIIAAGRLAMLSVHKTIQQGLPGADQDPGEHVPAEVVEAEPVLAARAD